MRLSCKIFVYFNFKLSFKQSFKLREIFFLIFLLTFFYQLFRLSKNPPNKLSYIMIVFIIFNFKYEVEKKYNCIARLVYAGCIAQNDTPFIG